MKDTSNIDLLIQYALLVAGERDDSYERQLGPIHLIKYVYLADLFYAKKNEGKSYTGVPWMFYKFGPWAREVNGRIEPALAAIGAQQFIQQSDYEDRDEWVRWSLRDADLYKEKEAAIPAAITLHLRKDILKYGKDTPSLLHYVYQSKPMLEAAPNEFLDLTLVVDRNEMKEGNQKLRADQLTNKKKKLLTQKIALMRNAYQEKKEERRRLVSPVAKPRFDAVYEEGVRWLDSLAGDAIPEKTFTATFSEEVWKSSTRKGDDVS